VKNPCLNAIYWKNQEGYRHPNIEYIIHQKDEVISMLGKKSGQFSLFQYITLDQLVPQDYFLRKVDRSVDFAPIRKLLESQYCQDNGRPSVDPEVVFRIVLIGFLYNLSDHRLFSELQMHAGFRWFIKYDFNEKLPDRTTIVKLRKRWGNKVFDQILTQLVAQCIEAGLVAGEKLIVDGTIIKANAAHNSLEAVKPEKTVLEYTKQFDDDGSDEPPKGSSSRKAYDPDFHGEKFSNQTHRSKTDPDARLYRKGKGKEAYLSYLGHYLVDGKVIVSAMATKATGIAEREAALVLLDKARNNLGIKPQSLLADKGYGSGEFLAQLLDRGIQPLVSMTKKQIEELPQWRRKTRVLKNYRKRKAELRAAKARNYTRIINSSRKYQRAYRYRTIVEHRYGEAKSCHGMGKARYRGLEQVDIQVIMTAIAQNIKRLANNRGHKKPVQENVMVMQERIPLNSIHILTHYRILALSS
jgi:transposase